MHPEDKKTSFIIEESAYCYTKMNFGLKNVGIAYQWLINKMFKDQLGKNMEVYLYFMIIKTIQALNHIEDLREVFEVIRRYGMRINLKKCVFGVTLGKFHNYLVSTYGIKENPNKIDDFMKI